MKRYEIAYHDDVYTEALCADGDWCKWEDVEPLLARAQELGGKIETIRIAMGMAKAWENAGRDYDVVDTVLRIMEED